jgi:hypothetical protein
MTRHCFAFGFILVMAIVTQPVRAQVRDCFAITEEGEGNYHCFHLRYDISSGKFVDTMWFLTTLYNILPEIPPSTARPIEAEFLNGKPFLIPLQKNEKSAKSFVVTTYRVEHPGEGWERFSFKLRKLGKRLLGSATIEWCSKGRTKPSVSTHQVEFHTR